MPRVPVFLTLSLFAWCMLPLCNADADEGKVLFSARL